MVVRILLILLSICFSSRAFATWYYASPTGSSSSCGVAAGNGPSSQLCSLDSAFNLAQAGDHIILTNGTYSRTSNRNTTRSGSSGNPITLRAQNPKQATIRATSGWGGQILDIRHSYWTVKDIIFNSQNLKIQDTVRIQAPKCPSGCPPSNGIIIENIETINNGIHGIGIFNTNNPIIRNNKITKTGDAALSNNTLSAEGMYVGGRADGDPLPVNGGEISGNTLTQIGGECIDVKEEARNLNIHHNICSVRKYCLNCERPQTGLMSCQGCRGVRYHNNIYRDYDATRTNWSGIWFIEGANDITIENNVAYNGSHGYVYSVPSNGNTNVIIRNNTFCNLNNYNTSGNTGGTTFTNNAGYHPGSGVPQSQCNTRVNEILSGVSDDEEPPPEPPPDPGPLVDIDDPNYGRDKQTCVTGQLSGTNGLVIVPDNNANLENAVSSNTSKTILIKGGGYNVTNFNPGANNKIQAYDCQGVTINIGATSDNTITSDGWSIEGVQFNCNSLDRECFRLCNADNTTIKNTNFRRVMRGAPRVTCNSINVMLDGLIVEGCPSCAQGNMISIGDTSDPGGVGCSGTPCRFGNSPNTVTLKDSRIWGNTSNNVEPGGLHMVSIEGISYDNIKITNNLFQSIQNLWTVINFENNWMRTPGTFQGGAEVSYNTIHGPFGGHSFIDGPSTPAFYFQDATGCKAADDCPIHRIHHNFVRDAYTVETSTDLRNLSGMVKFHSGRYSRAEIRHNIDRNDRIYRDSASEALHKVIIDHNSFFLSNIRLQNEVCTDTVSGDNLTVTNNAFAGTNIEDACGSGGVDWNISTNLFSSIAGGGFNAAHLDSGNVTQAFAYGNTTLENPDYTVSTLGQTQKGASPAPLIMAAKMLSSCKLNIDLSLYRDDTNGFYHGPISTVDLNKVTVRYAGTSQPESSWTTLDDDTVEITMAACPTAGQELTLTTSYGWCKDSANIGGTYSSIDGGCESVLNYPIVNDVGGDEEPPPGTDTFYVDNTCGTQGNGTTATCGTNGPWTSIKHALQVADCSGMAPGDILEIKGHTSLDLTCHNGGNCYFEDNINIDNACSGIIIQNKINTHVVVQGTIDRKSGVTWVSRGSGVYECTTSGCGGIPDDKFPFAAWYKTSGSEQMLVVDQTIRTCDTSLAAGVMRIEPVNQTLCVHLADNSNPASSVYFRIPEFELFITGSPVTTDNVIVRKNPSGTGSFNINRYRERGIILSPQNNTGWQFHGLNFSEIMDRCLAIGDSETAAANTQIKGNTFDYCGQEAIRLAEPGAFLIENNVITHTQSPPVFQLCNGIGAGCHDGNTDNGTAIRLIAANSLNGIIRGNYIDTNGGGRRGEFRGINLEHHNRNVLVENNRVFNSSNTPLQSYGIYLTGNFANDFNGNNIFRNNKIYNVDICYSQEYGDVYPSQAAYENWFYNNTCVNPRLHGMLAEGTCTGCQDAKLHVWNNIFAAYTGNPAFLSVPSTATGWTDFDNNVFECTSCSANKDIISVRGFDVERPADCTAGTDCINDWNTTSPDQIDISANIYGAIAPNLTGAPAPSLDITNTSAAYNAGRVVTGFTKDFYGKTRPQFTSYDAGAHEYDGGIEEEPPGTDIIQHAFKFYNRLLAHGKGLMAPENEVPKLYKRSQFLLRFAIYGASNSATQTIHIRPFYQYCTPSCGSWTAITEVCTGNPICIVNHPLRANNEPIENQINLDGRISSTLSFFTDATGGTQATTIEPNTQVEREYSLKMGTTAAVGNTINIRMEKNDGTDLSQYDITPSILIGHASGTGP